MSVRVVVCGKAAFVWNPDDVRQLREEHRIVGALVGAHPSVPYQNTNMSLPLKLMSEEVTLLRDKGLATLVDGVFNREPPNDELLAEYAEYRKQQYDGQNVIFQREQEENHRRFEAKIAVGREKKRQRAEARSVNVESSAEGGDSAVVIKPMAEEYTMVQLFHEEPWRPSWKPVEWSYPESSEERLRYAVFRDLWEKGYYLTSGGKFGGDFLVYPGDPLLYHSAHIAICLPDHSRLNARQLVAMGRLGSNVRKTVLICSTLAISETENFAVTDLQGHDSLGEIDSDTFKVNYLTLEWTGMN